MVTAAMGSLVRRGLEMGAAHMQKEPHQEYKLPPWGALILSVTVACFFVISFAIEYTFGLLIPTLLVIESPEAIVFEPLTTSDNDGPDAPINKTTDPELLVAQQKPITASFRATIRHLRSKGGFLSRFRGFSVFVVYMLLVQSVTGMLNSFFPILLSPIVALTVLTPLSLAWTHIVISDPSPKRWYRRVPSFKLWKKVAGPTALVAVAQQIAITLPIYLAIITEFFGNPTDFTKTTHAQRWIIALKALSIFVLSIVLSVLLVLPADVSLIRVQASLLPDELESIVPFDRSFGGKVVPEIVGGSGVIGMLDAWKTFDWNARVRLVKAYAKYFAMQIAVAVLFGITLTAQLALIVGKDFNKVIPGDGNAVLN